MTSMVQEFDIFGVFHCLEKGDSNGKKHILQKYFKMKWNVSCKPYKERCTARII